MRPALTMVMLLVACAHEPAAPPPIAPPAVAEAESKDPLTAYAGRYALGSSSAPSECGGKIYLAAKHLEIRPPTVYADVVDRTYVARHEDGSLVAEGRFDVAGICPGTQVFERWNLTRDGSGQLAGTLESHWSLPPDCQRACVVRFPIAAVPQ